MPTAISPCPSSPWWVMAGPGSHGMSQPSQKQGSWGHQGSSRIRHLSGNRGMPSPGWNWWATIFPGIKDSHIFQRMCGRPELIVGTGHMWHACNGSSHRPWSSGLLCQLQHAREAQATSNHPFSEETSEQSRNDTAISCFSAQKTCLRGKNCCNLAFVNTIFQFRKQPHVRIAAHKNEQTTAVPHTGASPPSGCTLPLTQCFNNPSSTFVLKFVLAGA